jgi:C4-dicarboxylate transporter DctQ subunit
MLDGIITKIEQIIISVGLASATLILFANVVARYAFDTGFTWALELVQYLFAWVVLVGAAYGVREGAHLGIEILVEKFSIVNQRRFAFLALFLSMFFIGWVFFLSIQYTMKIYQWGDLTLDLQIPQWIPYTAIPVGLGMMLFHFVQVGINIYKGKTIRIAGSEADEFADVHLDDGEVEK